MRYRLFAIAALSAALAACSTAPQQTDTAAQPTVAATATQEPTTDSATTEPTVDPTTESPSPSTSPSPTSTDDGTVKCSRAQVQFETSDKTNPDTVASDSVSGPMVYEGHVGLDVKLHFGCFGGGETMWVFTQADGQSYHFAASFYRNHRMTDARVSAKQIAKVNNKRASIGFTLAPIGARDANAQHVVVTAYRANKACDSALLKISSSDGSTSEIPSGCSQAGLLDVVVVQY